MAPLLRMAFEMVGDAELPVGLRAAASAALLHAIENGIEVPPGAHMALWCFMLSSEASAATLHRQRLIHPDVAADAIRVLLDRSTSEAERDLALGALRDSNLNGITEQQVAGVVDRALDEGRARQAGHLIESVHEEVGLSAEFLQKARDRLAEAHAPAVRSTAVDVARLLPAFDGAFWASCFADRSPVVRTAVAQALELADKNDDVAQAISLIRERLKIEGHRSVIAACLSALGSLIRIGAQGTGRATPHRDGDA
jgi:hypothetical protein